MIQKDGNIQKGAKAIDDILKQWKKQGLISEQSKYKQTLNIVFSVKQEASAEQIEQAVTETANMLFDKNEWVYAVHTDTDNPHVHLCVTMRDYEGKRLNPRKNDLFLWRNVFADRLQALGVQCTATKRIHRGLLPDNTPASFYHMRAREAIIDKQQHKYEQLQAILDEDENSVFKENLKTAPSPTLGKQIQNQQHLVKGYRALARSLYLEGHKTEAKAISQLANQVQNSTLETQEQSTIKQIKATGKAPKPYSINQLYQKAESQINQIETFLQENHLNEQQAKAIARRLYQKGFKTQARKVSTWSKNHIQDKPNTL